MHECSQPDQHRDSHVRAALRYLSLYIPLRLDSPLLLLLLLLLLLSERQHVNNPLPPWPRHVCNTHLHIARGTRLRREDDGDVSQRGIRRLLGKVTIEKRLFSDR